MALTTEQKECLTEELTPVQTRFDEYKATQAYMAVYFTDICKAFITFGPTSTFRSTIYIGKKLCTLACVYDCAGDFTTQTDAFLA